MRISSEVQGGNATGGIRGGSLLRRALVAASILVLAGLGVYEAWSAERWDLGLLGLAGTLGPAAAFAFGYFRNLPDVLGASAVRQRGTLWQQWSDFARLTAAVAVLITWIGTATLLIESILKNNMAMVDAAETLIWPIAVTLLMAGCVGASEQYLAHTLSGEYGSGSGAVGWRAIVRRLVGFFRTTLAKWISAKRALVTGSTLVMASLILTTTLMGSCADEPGKGYEIVSGKAVWITAEQTNLAGLLKYVVAQLDRGIYVLGLAVAFGGLAAVLAGRAGDALRRNRILAAASGVIAIFGICDYTFAWARFSRSIIPNEGMVAIWIAVWVLPIMLWLRRARRGESQGDWTRLAVMILYLLVCFVSVALLVFLAPGHQATRSSSSECCLSGGDLCRASLSLSGRHESEARETALIANTSG